MTDTIADKKKLELIRLKNEYAQKLSVCYDPSNPSSRPTKKQDGILKDGKNRIFWVLGGNRSGKTALGGRVTAWWFKDTHPHIKRPKEWGAGPLQILVVAKTNEMAESEIWEKKIKPFSKC